MLFLKQYKKIIWWTIKKLQAKYNDTDAGNGEPKFDLTILEKIKEARLDFFLRKYRSKQEKDLLYSLRMKILMILLKS